jgi:hypothetical protein
LTFSTTSVTAIVSARLGLTFVGEATGLAGNALECVWRAGLGFEAIAARWATVPGKAALLASARAFIFDAYVAFAAIMTFGTNATNVLTGAFIPTALLVRHEERRH